jgi:hypothetical protein
MVVDTKVVINLIAPVAPAETATWVTRVLLPRLMHLLLFQPLHLSVLRSLWHQVTINLTAPLPSTTCRLTKHKPDRKALSDTGRVLDIESPFRAIGHCLKMMAV